MKLSGYSITVSETKLKCAETPFPKSMVRIGKLFSDREKNIYIII